MKAILSIMRFVFSTIKAICLIVFFIILLSVLSVYLGDEEKQDKSMSVDFLNKTYFAEFYLLNNFTDNESCIKYLFGFANNKNGRLIFVTNKKGVYFEDGVFFFNNKYPNFFFSNQDLLKNNNYDIIRFDYRKAPNILSFSIKEYAIKKKLLADFDSLNLNIIQDMLDFIKADSAKFNAYNYTYELYNRDGIRKVAIDYHENGKWFEIEVL